MKIKNKLFSLLLALCLTFTLAIPTYANTNYGQSNSNQNYSLSVEDYKSWIKSKINMKDSNSYEAQIFLNEFNNLTEDKQEMFVSYITNPDLVLNILNAISSGKEYSTLENGNIVITNNQNFQDEQTKATTQYRVATGYSNVIIAGIKVFEYQSEMRYSHNGSSIQEISHAKTWISKSFIPFVDFSWDTPSTYGVGTKVAHHIEYCTWSLVHSSIGVHVGTHQIEITGDIYNETQFSVS